MNALPIKLQEQTLDIVERVSIAAHLGQWFYPVPTGAVIAERRFPEDFQPWLTKLTRQA